MDYNDDGNFCWRCRNLAVVDKSVLAGLDTLLRQIYPELEDNPLKEKVNMAILLLDTIPQ